MSIVEADPATAWSALAPLLAGQARVRLSFDRGRSYPQKHERNLSAGLPSVPAAVRIYGPDGACAAIFLDFDSSIAGVDWVDADVRAAQTWLHRCGARWIEDSSPNGGRHLYIPLKRRVAFQEARELVEALGHRLRSLDKTPHQNLQHGCMRTPGSPHKIKGAYQQLAMSLSMAYDVAKRPNTGSVWDAMVEDLGDEILAVRAFRADQSHSPIVAESDQPASTGTDGRMSRSMQRIATSGLYDTNKYSSDSEARQAILLSAAAAGLSLADVDRRIKQGIWPGLASFFARYAPRHRTPALRRDWVKAESYLRKQQPSVPGKNNARKNPTSEPPTQRGYLQGGSSESASVDTEHRLIRTWRNALRFCERRYEDARSGLGRRMVLRALGEAAHKSGSRFIEFGSRSLAIASGMDHTTVGGHLRALRAEQDPLIELVQEARGRHGDLYLLRIPDSVSDRAHEEAWRGGKLYALRPVFRELGLPAAFVYEALEVATTALSTGEIITRTGLSRTAVTEALHILAAWNLASKQAGWSIVATTSLTALAEHFGILEAVAAQCERYRLARDKWHAWLDERVLMISSHHSPGEDYPWHEFEGPPDELTLADLAFEATG